MMTMNMGEFAVHLSTRVSLIVMLIMMIILFVEVALIHDINKGCSMPINLA